MQSLVGKERVLQAFDDKRSTARFFRLMCAPLPFIGATATILSGGNIADATFYAMLGWIMFSHAQNEEANTEFEILAQCVGRPRLAKAAAKRCSIDNKHSFFFECLGNLERLNGTQKELLQGFFLLPRRQILEEDWIAAQNLLARGRKNPSRE